MLDPCDDEVTAFSQSGHSLNCQVVCFGASSREENLIRAGIQELSHRFPGGFEQDLRSMSVLMDAGRVSIAGVERLGQSRTYFRSHRYRCVIIEINAPHC